MLSTLVMGAAETWFWLGGTYHFAREDYILLIQYISIGDFEKEGLIDNISVSDLVGQSREERRCESFETLAKGSEAFLKTGQNLLTRMSTRL